ncbi:hypothetical protein Ddye_016366 [Dipteronia dyeriana]|uniref:RNase H type-1 domain-containing protein n=1 Tax=Dipteronia dyeriana TaxID=168575 RepID=A0AAD9U6R3_9ROSI|nr:hypothetical protein Ddye_016366 [Dipteronia dyeriana]
MKIPSNVKLLIWSSCHNWIPTSFNLAGRGVDVNSFCPVCRRQPESTLRALWTCPSLQQIRDTCIFMPSSWFCNNASFMDFMISHQHRISFADMELLCMVIWRIWFRRNCKVYYSATILNREVVTWVSSFLADSRRANTSVKLGTNVRGNVVGSWRPTEVGISKVNTHAAVETVGGKMGVGIIIRDSLEDVFASSAQHLEMWVSPAVAEAVATYKGLIFACDSGLLSCTVESDAHVVVIHIAAGSIPLSDIGIIISDIPLLLRCHPGCNVVFASRKSNSAAHYLAKLGPSCAGRSLRFFVVLLF